MGKSDEGEAKLKKNSISRKDRKRVFEFEYCSSGERSEKGEIFACEELRNRRGRGSERRIEGEGQKGAR